MNLSVKSFAAGAAAMLVLGTGSAVAATGGKLILGHTNASARTTVISDTKGTPLSLKAPSSKPPLTVSNSRLVSKLNADLLDGRSSSAFALATGTTGEYVNDYAPFAFDLNGDKTDDSTAVFATCPAGSVPTGGGVYNPTGVAVEDEELVPSSVLKSGKNGRTDSYVVAVAGTALAGASTQLGAYVFCYDPKSPLPAQISSNRAAAPSGTSARLGQALASLHQR